MTVRRWQYGGRMTQRRAAPGFAAAVLLPVLLGLTGCMSNGGNAGTVTSSDLFDMKLQHIVTSPVPGATARVLPSPPGAKISGPNVAACVTDGGYCPLAAATEAGRNCLCQTQSFTYGGVTAEPPKYNTATNPW